MASKHSGARAGTSEKLGLRAAAQPKAPADAALQEQVLGEIRHELGNFFHKLYYWSDYLKERTADKGQDATATQMLQRTIQNLEDFLRVALDYFQPAELCLTRMAASELVDGLLSQLRAHLNGTPVAVRTDGEWRGEEVVIDPGHFSQAWTVAVRCLADQVGPDSTLQITIGRGLRRQTYGLEVGLELHRPNETQALFRTSEAGLQWAVAKKLLTLHGGELLESTEMGDEKRLTVFIPLSAAPSV
jgi:signal transduction histidine kinase